MKKHLIAKLALIALAAVAGAAQADVVSPAPTFLVKIKITKTCAVTTAPTDIDLGSVAATSSAVSQTGNNSFKVNCSKKTPFFIGLAPSSANGGTVNGTGNMASAVAGNTDLVPYTLYSNAGMTTVWGNTATASAVGNGVAGTGAGMATGNALTFSAYAKATSADFTPDDYKDTVTVNVNY